MRVPVEVKLSEEQLKDILVEKLGVDKKAIKFRMTKLGLNEGAYLECVISAEVEFPQAKTQNFTAVSRKDRDV